MKGNSFSREHPAATGNRFRTMMTFFNEMRGFKRHTDIVLKRLKKETVRSASFFFLTVMRLRA